MARGAAARNFVKREAAKGAAKGAVRGAAGAGARLGALPPPAPPMMAQGAPGAPSASMPPGMNKGGKVKKVGKRK